MLWLELTKLLTLFLASVAAKQVCKTTPFDPSWPSSTEWSALNASLNGALLATTPVASSCWAGNPFNSDISCNVTEANWSSSIFHAARPESMGAWLFANNSCIPPTVDGYEEARGCHLGGLPSYIVNATTEIQVATALKWAAARNIRVVIKGTGHDLSGRSSGAFALSIWTRHFRQLRRETCWQVPGSNETTDVLIVGSGLGWGDVLDFALDQGRVVTTGQDGSVGPGGYIQGGGHGPLASTYGLGAHQVLQATVVTTTGEILVANDLQNQDIFWAIRGGGGGQYGVVTEFVIRHFPAPSSIAMGTLSLAPLTESGANASWDAAAVLLRKLPDLMDAGIAGAMTLATGERALYFNPSLKSATSGAVTTQVFWAFNQTSADLDALVEPVMAKMSSYGSNTSISLSFSSSNFANYTSFYNSISGSNTAGAGGVLTSRLLGRPQLTDLNHTQLRTYLQRAVTAQNQTRGTYATIGLSGGPGVINTPESRWGSLHSAWRSAYLHFYVGGSSPNATTPKGILEQAAEWTQENKEPLWRDWAPEMGSYMNEGNPYSEDWKDDFYGENYERLLAVKRNYDPNESLFVLSGVGSEGWEYDLDSGKLCKEG